MIQTIEDKDLGQVNMQKSVRAKQYTIRIRRGIVSVTLPFFGSYRKALTFLYDNKAKILSQLEQSKAKAFPEVDKNKMRKTARLYLSNQLSELASSHGFHYQSLRISSSTTRWGSCSSKASINLSLYLMLLPEHLIDYVILHELCHTIHLNHSPAFWALLDEHTQGKAKALRKELREYKF